MVTCIAKHPAHIARYFLLLCLALNTDYSAAQESDSARAEARPTTGETEYSYRFQLRPGSLEENIKRLLIEDGRYQLLLWHVSPRYQVLVPSLVKGSSLHAVVDKIISAYHSPYQVRARFYEGNQVARFYYAEKEQ